ncbi:MAG: 50S ribosomal protein L9 [Neisseriaceae bacterium]
MKIILLEDVANLGKIGDIVDVKNGFARNFLIPFGRAKRATKENIAAFEAKRSEYEAKQDQKLAHAKSRFEQINEKVFTVTAKAGVDGKLFGSVNSLDIVEAAKASGIELQKSEVTLPNGPLKTIGEFDINVILHHDINALVKINVIAES